jgi:hypothetical protein
MNIQHVSALLPSARGNRIAPLLASAFACEWLVPHDMQQQLALLGGGRASDRRLPKPFNLG